MDVAEIARQILPFGLVNIIVTVVSFPLALVVAIIVAAVRIARIPVLSQLCAIYVDVVRMTPLVLHLFFFFFALPLIGIMFSANASVVIAMALHIGAYRNLYPKKVHLHTGTRIGAAAIGLGIGRDELEPGELPVPFRRLQSYEIEDCLCIYKRDLARIYTKRQ